MDGRTDKKRSGGTTDATAEDSLIGNPKRCSGADEKSAAKNGQTHGRKKGQEAQVRHEVGPNREDRHIIKEYRNKYGRAKFRAGVGVEQVQVGDSKRNGGADEKSTIKPARTKRVIKRDRNRHIAK